MEDSLEFYSGMGGTPAPTWNDQPFDDPNCGGYVVERSDDPRPPGFDVTELMLVGSLALTNQGDLRRVTVSGTHALVTTGERSVHLVDFSTPANPTSRDLARHLSGVRRGIGGESGYVASYELDFLSTVEIVDFSDPTKPVLKGYYDTLVEILDVSDPASPWKLGRYDIKGSIHRVAVAGLYAYVADGGLVADLRMSALRGSEMRLGGYEVTGGIQALVVS